jgi:hypothetical protein
MTELTKKEKIALEFAKAIASNIQLVQLYPDFKKDKDGGLTISHDLYFNTIVFFTEEFMKRVNE